MKFERMRQAAFAVAAAVVTASFGFSGSTVQAATLTFKGEFANDKSITTYNKNVSRATLTCVFCQGIMTSGEDGSTLKKVKGEDQVTGIFPTVDPSTFNGFYDAVTGTDTGKSDLFYAENNSEDTIAGFISNISGKNFTKKDIEDNRISVNKDFYDFKTDAEWIIFKIGKDPDLTVVRNEYGLQDFRFAALKGQGAGLSSVTFLSGDGVVVPEISATGSVAAFGSVFALMAFFLERRGGVSRRRRSVA